MKKIILGLVVGVVSLFGSILGVSEAEFAIGMKKHMNVPVRVNEAMSIVDVYVDKTAKRKSGKEIVILYVLEDLDEYNPKNLGKEYTDELIKSGCEDSLNTFGDNKENGIRYDILKSGKIVSSFLLENRHCVKYYADKKKNN